MTLNVDDSAYETLKGLLLLLPEDKVSLVDGERASEPNEETIKAIKEIDEKRTTTVLNLRAYAEELKTKCTAIR